MMYRKTLALASALAACTLPSHSASAVASQIPGRDLRTNPPRIATIAVTPLGISAGGEKGLLKIRFAETGLPASLKFNYRGQIKTLHDDGAGEDAAKDGIYSALIDFDLAEMAEFQTTLQADGQLDKLQNMAAASQGDLVAGTASTTADTAVPQPSATTGLDPEKTLFIRDLSVVNSGRTADPCLSTNATDATKKWSWGYLMTQMANQAKTGRTASDLALSLLRQWEQPRTVNGQVVPARPEIRARITDKWLRASGNTGKLAMNKAPFRLLGIVNRIDLRQNLFFGEGLAGEMRFVWGILDLESKAADGTCQEDPSFTMIMEYAVDKNTQDEVKAWGQKWAALNTITPFNSLAYRDALQSITESVVKADVGAAFGRANGSALIRIRTNEISLSSPWELREFNLAQPTHSNPGLFFETTTKQTPGPNFNGTAVFRDWVNANETKILAGTHNVPATFQSQPFLGGHSLNNIDFWSAAGINSNRARHLVSLNTCNGCHGAETNTGFLQVFPRDHAHRAQLSGFLLGEDVTDPVDPTKTRHFNDLARRATDLNTLVTSPTVSQLSFVPTNRTE